MPPHSIVDKFACQLAKLINKKIEKTKINLKILNVLKSLNVWESIPE